MVVIEQGGCVSPMLLYSGRWYYSGEKDVFGHGCCIRAKWLYSGKSGCMWKE